MKRKNSLGISMVITLLMITSVFTVGITTSTPAPNKGYIDVVKTVYNGIEWVDLITAKTGDIVQFNITFTYHNTSQGADNFHFNETTVTDYLSSALQYTGMVEPPSLTPQIIGNTLVWHLFTTPYNRGLEKEQHFTIRFYAKILGCDRIVNRVNVTGKEHCSGHPLFGEDSAFISVPVSFIIDKKVWNPDANQGQGGWAENLPYVLKDDNVKFQITATYYGCSLMKCFVLWDEWPGDCIVYSDNVTITIAGVPITPNDRRYPDIRVGEGATIEICEEDHLIPPNTVFWDWRNRDFGLANGESVVVEFTARVVHYCNCSIPLANIAHGLIWGCSYCDPCNHQYDQDTANITCCPPPTRFQKKVWDDRQQGWVEETTAVVGDTVRFRLALTYYGVSQEFNISIKDQLPECLEYANAATKEPTKVSSDKRTIWWNFTKTLSDSEVLSIEFNAKVVNTTECCEGINNATITLQACQQPPKTYWDTAGVIGIANQPPTPPALEKAMTGTVNQELSFTVKSFDSENNTVYYYIDWGNANSGWIGPYPQGVLTTVKHTWTAAGEYTLKAKAQDSHGAESVNWGNSILVKITGGVTPPPPSGKNITITGLTKKLNKIIATIKNNGTVNNKTINWTIEVVGNLVTRKNILTNGSIVLDAGKTADVTGKAKAKPFGFGKITITVTAKAGAYGKATLVKTGFLFGPFIFGLK